MLVALAWYVIAVVFEVGALGRLEPYLGPSAILGSLAGGLSLLCAIRAVPLGRRQGTQVAMRGNLTDR